MNLQMNEILYSNIIEHRDKMVFIAQILILFCAFIHLIYRAYHNTIEEKTKYGDSFVQIGFVILALAFYSVWTGYIADIFILIAKEVGTSSLIGLEQVIAKAYKTHSSESYFLIKGSLNTLVITVCLLICLFFVKAAAFLFEIGQLVSMALLLILGPFPIVFSLLPNYSKTFWKWLGSFMSVNFWLVIYAVIISLFNALMSDKLEFWIKEGIGKGNNPIMDVTELLIYCLSFLISILFIPKISSSILSSEDVFDTVSSTTQVAVLLASKFSAAGKKLALKGK